MDKLEPPFIAVEGSDVSIYESLHHMASQFEAFDVGANEFFDARGRLLSAVTEGYRVVTFVPLPGAPNPERLVAALGRYFKGLSDRDGAYANAAREALSLDDLVRLRLELENRPRPSLFRRVLRRRK